MEVSGAKNRISAIILCVIQFVCPSVVALYSLSNWIWRQLQKWEIMQAEKKSPSLIMQLWAKNWGNMHLLGQPHQTWLWSDELRAKKCWFSSFFLSRSCMFEWQSMGKSSLKAVNLKHCLRRFCGGDDAVMDTLMKYWGMRDVVMKPPGEIVHLMDLSSRVTGECLETWCLAKLVENDRKLSWEESCTTGSVNDVWSWVDDSMYQKQTQQKQSCSISSWDTFVRQYVLLISIHFLLRLNADALSALKEEKNVWCLHSWS